MDDEAKAGICIECIDWDTACLDSETALDYCRLQRVVYHMRIEVDVGVDAEAHVATAANGDPSSPGRPRQAVSLARARP
jgi:hypothetical protein